MKTTLICTVGTSLFEGNLKHLSKETPGKPDNWGKISEYYLNENWAFLAKELIKIEPTARLAGAEINTIEESLKKKWLKIENLIFLISDTKLGENTGKVLKHYYENRTDIKLKNEVIVRPIEKLQDPSPNEFKTKGLRNLVRIIGEYLERFKPENCAIDATGGYKAQIAIAVLIGQALDIPVYYKHERFNEIIDFPRLPVSLDYDLLGRNAHILTLFEKGEDLSSADLGDFDERIKVFLNEIEVDGEYLYTLNAIGQLYLTSFYLRYKKNQILTACPAQKKKSPTFRDDHYPKGFKDFVNKVWTENKWIQTCWSLDYSKQKSIRGIEFFVRKMDDENELVGTFKEKDFGARYRIKICDENIEKLNLAAYRLNQKYNS